MYALGMLLYAVGLLLTPQLPENTNFDHSGLPKLSVAGVRFVSHSVTLELWDKEAVVTSTSVFKNGDAQVKPAQVVLPRQRIGDSLSGYPTFALTATWDNKPLMLAAGGARSSEKTGDDGKTYLYKNDLAAKVTLNASATHALRISYKTPLGRTSFERKKLITGYVLEGSQPIGQLNITYRYGGKTVFRLPESHPSQWPWQVGQKGAFIRHTEFTPQGERTFITFYPGGFENIGGTGGGGL